MKFLDSDIAPLGLGCWPIGGKMFANDGQSLGYTNADDNESIKAIHAALANGITLFDTAAAYGAGHSERLLAKGLKDQANSVVVSKIGIAIDEKTKTLIGEDISPESVMPAINQCLERLDRDYIDLMLLHPNDTPIEQAMALFEEMKKAQASGKIKAYGWSTDHIANVEATAGRDGFQAVEYAMNVFMDAPNMQQLVNDKKLYSLIRSPLAMGLLSGKYTTDTKLPKEDIRATNQGWVQYYVDGKPNPAFIDRLDAIRDLLESGGRTLVQGALAWLWAKSPDNIALPGARTVKQVEGLAAAIALGPLPASTVNEIAGLVGSEFESEGTSAR